MTDDRPPASDMPAIPEFLDRRIVDWQAMQFDDRKEALGERWRGFQRRSLEEAWNLGHGLRAVRNEMHHGEWAPYLEEIGMDRNMARRFMDLADGFQIAQIETFASVDAALKALPPKRPKEEPPPPPQPEPDADAVDEEEAQDAVDEVADEAIEEQRQAERETRDERLAVRLEGTDGDAVEALSTALDRADKRHEEDVEAVNAAREGRNTERRRADDICNALLSATPDTALQVIDDVLARFFGVARKA